MRTYLLGATGMFCAVGAILSGPLVVAVAFITAEAIVMTLMVVLAVRRA